VEPSEEHRSPVNTGRSGAGDKSGRITTSEH